MPQTIEVESDGKERLDKFLVRYLVGRSRSQIQKLIEAGVVIVNHRQTSAHTALKRGDVVTVNDEVAVRETPIPKNLPLPTVIFEDDDLLVINKPSGLTVHAGVGIQHGTLVDWLREHVPTIANVGDDPAQRPGIVHRLDRDVSGVMVIAKTQRAFDHLKRQFQERDLTKEYIALVYGIPKNPHGTIDFNIDRSERMHGRMAARPSGGGGRSALTHYQVETIHKNNALLRIQIETGRTHQIRVHLKAFGHPIVGDRLYTTKPFRRKHQPVARPFLHAARLTLTDLSGNPRSFEAPLPEDLRRFLDA